MAIEEPIIVTDTGDLQRMFEAHISGWFAANGIGIDARRLAIPLIETLRWNCPTPPTLVDALGGEWFWNAGYVDGDGNLRSRESLDEDPDLSPMTVVED